jgi:uncharacterized protein YrrD
MRFQENAEIVASDGKNVGRLDRVVLDPRTHEVAAIILRKGGELREDKVVPLDLIESANGGGVRLRRDAEAVAALEPFEEKHYVVVDEHDLVRELGAPPYPGAPLYGYPPYPGLGAPVFSPFPARPAVIARAEENIPPNTIALRAGARVVDREGETVGSIERILTDPLADRATHFVIERGFVLKDRKMIPMQWVDSLGEDTVRLAVGLRQVQRLRTYED